MIFGVRVGAAAQRPPFRAPVSEHHDAQWYRAAATKTSEVTSEPLPDGSTSDDLAWVAVSHLGAGLALYTMLGWLVGGWLGSHSVGAAVGALLGVSFALYLVYARLVAKRSGTTTPRQDVS